MSLLTFKRRYLAVLGLIFTLPRTSNRILDFSWEVMELESSNIIERKSICRAYNIKFCSIKKAEIFLSPSALPRSSRRCLPSLPPAIKTFISMIWKENEISLQ